MKKALVLLIAVLLVISVVAGCGRGGSPTVPSTETKGAFPSNSESSETDPVKPGGTLNLALDADIDTLNPHMERSSADAELIWSVGGVLYRILPGSETPYQIVPEYADGEPEMLDEKGLIWKIKVIDGAMWADGKPLTASDFVYSLKMYYDPVLLNAPGTSLDEYGVYIKNASEYFSSKGDGAKETMWEDVGVKLLDGNAMELTLTKPVNASQLMLCFSSCVMVPVREDLYEAGMNASKDETNYGTAANKVASSGPFQITGWTKDASITMERNPNYPLADQIALDGIQYRIVPESGTRLQLFESGQIDMVSLSDADMEKYGEDPRVLDVPGGGVMCIGINMISEENVMLKNQKFRQALYFGTNRQEAAKLGNNIPADYFITPPYILDIKTGLSYRDTEEADSYIDKINFSYNPEKAKRLFEEALQETGLDQASIQILYQDSSESRKKIVEYLQNSWQKLFGIDKFTVKLQAMAGSQLSSLYRSHKDNPNAFESGVIQSVYNLLDPASALMEWNKNASRKKIPYYDDEFTAIYDELKALSLDEVAERRELIAKAEKVMLDDAPFIPVVLTVAKVLVAERVRLPFTTYNSVLRFVWPWATLSK